MRTFGLLFAAGLVLVPSRGLLGPSDAPTMSSSAIRALEQAKPDVPAQKVTPSPTPKPEALPELLALQIENLQLRYQAAQHVLEQSDAYKTFAAASSELGKQMDALVTPYGKSHNCSVDQLAKTCVPVVK